MKNITLVLLLLLPVLGFSQKMYEEKLDDCSVKFEMEDDYFLINYLSNDSIMVVDFLSGLEQKNIDKLKGVIMFQVMVDTANQVCLISYTNKTNMSKKRLDMSERVKSMPSWSRTDNADPNKSVSALIAIIFDKTQIHVQRTGYSRNTGKKVLNYTTFNRKKQEKVKPITDSLPSN